MSELRVEIPESIREYLSYDEETGDLTWIKGKRGTKKGSKAGCKHREYMVVKFEQKCFMYHNVCWYLKTGEQSCEFNNMITVDHINRNGHDNRWENLRKCTKSEQNRNRSRMNNSSNPYPGIRHLKDSDNKERKVIKRWEASIGINGRMKHLGTFHTYEEAIAVRKEAEEKALEDLVDAEKDLPPRGIGLDTMDMNVNDWSEYEKLVMAEIKRLNEGITALTKEINQLHRDTDILKVKAGVWGLMGGLIPALAALAFYMLGK